MYVYVAIKKGDTKNLLAKPEKKEKHQNQNKKT